MAGSVGGAGGGAKGTDDLTNFFVLLGSLRVKAAHKMLVKWRQVV